MFQYLEVRYCRTFYSCAKCLDCNHKAKGVWHWKTFTQRVKYSDLCVRKNPSGKDYDMPERVMLESERPLECSWQSQGTKPNSTYSKVERRVLKQGSPTPGTGPGTGPWPVRNLAAEQNASGRSSIGICSRCPAPQPRLSPSGTRCSREHRALAPQRLGTAGCQHPARTPVCVDFPLYVEVERSDCIVPDSVIKSPKQAFWFEVESCPGGSGWGFEVPGRARQPVPLLLPVGGPAHSPACAGRSVLTGNLNFSANQECGRNPRLFSRFAQSLGPRLR